MKCDKYKNFPQRKYDYFDFILVAMNVLNRGPVAM